MENRDIPQIDVNLIYAQNKRAQQLNNERQQQLGAVEMAKKNAEAVAQKYEQIYGVKLTPENCLQEYIKVAQQLQEQVEAQRKQIEYIESGAYKAEKPKSKIMVDSTGDKVVVPVEDVSKTLSSTEVGNSVDISNSVVEQVGIMDAPHLKGKENQGLPMTDSFLNSLMPQDMLGGNQVNRGVKEQANVGKEGSVSDYDAFVNSLMPKDMGTSNTVANIKGASVGSLSFSDDEDDLDVEPIQVAGWGTLPIDNTSDKGEDINQVFGNILGTSFKND